MEFQLRLLSRFSVQNCGITQTLSLFRSGYPQKSPQRLQLFLEEDSWRKDIQITVAWVGWPGDDIPALVRGSPPRQSKALFLRRCRCDRRGDETMERVSNHCRSELRIQQQCSRQTPSNRLRRIRRRLPRSASCWLGLAPPNATIGAESFISHRASIMRFRLSRRRSIKLQRMSWLKDAISTLRAVDQ